jgi:predicted helicase
VVENVERMVDFYNEQVESFTAIDNIDLDPTRFSWNRADRSNVAAGVRYLVEPSMFRVSAYRPFQRQIACFERTLNDMVYRLQDLYPVPGVGGRSITMTSAGSHYEFAPLMVDALPNLHVLDTAQVFARHTWKRVEELELATESDDHPVIEGYRRIDNIDDEVLAEYQRELGDDITGDALFDYVYGLLHSPEYRSRFAADLNKMLPRVPRVATREAFDAFRDAGRALGDLHVNYESVDPYPLDEQVASAAPIDDYDRWRVEKMRFARTRGDDGKLVADRSTMIYNVHVTLAGIPEDAYRYVLGPRSAIEWIIDRYQVRTDKASGIVNDPNDWSREVGDPRYIVDLLKRIVTVSIETNRIVDSLPPLDDA